MFRKNMAWSLSIVAAAVVLGVVAACPAQADYLLDTFNNTQTSTAYRDIEPGDGLGDWGVNQELAARQSGTLAPVTYDKFVPANSRMQVNGTTCPGQLGLITTAGGDSSAIWASLQHDFPLDGTVSATITPNVLNSADATVDWAGIGIRGVQSDFRKAPSGIGGGTNLASGAFPITSAWITIQQNGVWNYFENGAYVRAFTTGGSVLAAASYNVSMTAIGDRLTGSINGVAIDLNGVDSGMARTMTATDIGLHNYVALNAVGCSGANETAGYRISTFDNLRIVGVPEPGTLTLVAMGLIGLLAYAWRRRK